MNIYSVINDALDQLYNELPQFYQDRDAAVWGALERLANRYGNLANVNIDYNDAATRYAYLYKYAGSRACAVYTHHDLFGLANLYEGNYLRQTSLGAGPGSDFLGVLRYYVQLESQIDFQVNFVDADATWGPTAEVVTNAASNHLNGCPRPNTRYRRIDCSAENVAAELVQFQDSNLFTLSYLLSELSDEAARRLVGAVLEILRPGAVILIIDNDILPIRELLNAAAQTAGIHVEKCRSETIYLRNESVLDMGNHYERFGDFDQNGFPHITLDAFCFAATKQ